MTDKPMTMRQARAELGAMDYSLRRTGHSDELRIAPRGGTAEQREACAYYTNDLGDAIATARFERSRAVLLRGEWEAVTQRMLEAPPFSDDPQPQGRDCESEHQYPGERLIGRLADSIRSHDEDRER